MTDKTGNSFVNSANDPDMVKLKKFVDKGVYLNSINYKKETALIVASKIGLFKTVDFLIMKGSNLNYQDEDGKTALVLAIENGYADVVDLLLRNGANPRLPCEKGRFHAGHILLQVLEKPFGQLFIDKFESILTLMLQNGLPINQSNVYGKSLLHDAIETKIPLSLTTFLIENGADIFQKSSAGHEPIHYAAIKGYPDQIDLLIKNGVDINALNLMGETPIYLASRKEMMQSILKYNPLFEMYNNFGETPLISHLEHNDGEKDFFEKIVLLVQAGANIDFPNPVGDTAQKIVEKYCQKPQLLALESFEKVLQFFSSEKARLAVQSLLSSQLIPVANLRSKTF
jgi:ankyrin repeat protein